MEEKQEAEPVLCSDPELVYLFPFYIIGDGLPNERKKIEEHLSECDACRKEMELFSDLQRIGEDLFGDA